MNDIPVFDPDTLSQTHVRCEAVDAALDWLADDEAAILARQERWREEDARALNAAGHRDNLYDLPEFYVREQSKPGRNDPYPCGSGMTYKKCCLPADEAREARVRQIH